MPTDNITLAVKPWTGSPHGKLAMKYEARCECCNRPKAYHAGFYVMVVSREGSETTFAPVALADIDIDNFSELDTLGTSCGKRLPATHRISLKALTKHLEGC